MAEGCNLSGGRKTVSRLESHWTLGHTAWHGFPRLENVPGTSITPCKNCTTLLWMEDVVHSPSARSRLGETCWLESAVQDEQTCTGYTL